MLRSVLTAVVLASVLAAMQPGAADPLAARAADHAHAASEPAVAPSWSSGMVTPSANAQGQEAPVGFGWG